MFIFIHTLPDPPTTNTLSQQNIIEGRNLSVTGQATFGNPSLTTIYWTKVDNPGFRQNGSTLQLPNIQKNGFDIYKCASENIYSSGGEGDTQSAMVVNVLFVSSRYYYMYNFTFLYI